MTQSAQWARSLHSTAATVPATSGGDAPPRRKVVTRLASAPATRVGAALAQLRGGGLVILHDAQRDRGDLIAAAERTTAETVNEMAVHGRGFVAVAMTPQRADDLGLERLPVRGDALHGRCDRVLPMVSIEGRWGVTTGISAADRARTITTVAASDSAPSDLVSPGHVFPLTSSEGGLLERYSRVDAAVDAVRLAGLTPVSTVCDVLDEDGELAGGADLYALAERLELPMVTVGELVEARFDEQWGGW
jgi:3,4-dihydroxy 2-butanone 4-phosphate synthase / GTP cyclohydrolase II